MVCVTLTPPPPPHAHTLRTCTSHTPGADGRDGARAKKTSKDQAWGLEPNLLIFFETEKGFPSQRHLREPAENVSGPSSTWLCQSKLGNAG